MVKVKIKYWFRFIIVMIRRDMLINKKYVYFFMLYWYFLNNSVLGMDKKILVNKFDRVRFKVKIWIWNSNWVYF